MTQTGNLQEFLASPGNYTRLDLSGQNITDADCQALANALRASQLQELILKECKISNILELCSTLPGTLTKLDLTGIGLESDRAEFLVREVVRSHITHLILDDNKDIGPGGIIGIAGYIYSTSDTALTHLSLRNVNIDRTIAVAFAQALVNTRSLTHLDLSHNQIDDDSATQIREILERMGDGCDLSDQHPHGEFFFAQQGADAPELHKLTKLLNEGNERLSQPSEKAILLMGHTGAGKTTLAHILANRDLRAVLKRGEMLLEAVEPLEGFEIGHGNSSETALPNKLPVNGEITIWDCPGFDDTDISQEIANNFYIKKLVSTSTKIKLILTVNSSSITDKRGKEFVSTLETFMNTINNAERLVNSISLVITKTDQRQQLEDFHSRLEELCSGLEQPMAQLIRGILKNDSLYLCHRPQEEGDYQYLQLMLTSSAVNLLESIEKKCSYAEGVSPDRVNVLLSRHDEITPIVNQGIHTTKSNIKKILTLIQQHILAQTNSIDILDNTVLLQHHEELSRNWIPETRAPNFQPRQTTSLLPHLKQLERLNNLFELYGTPNSLEMCVIVMSDALRSMLEFSGTDNWTTTPSGETYTCSSVLLDYNYVLRQQNDFLLFFLEIINQNSRAESAEMMEDGELLTEMQTLMDNCKQQLSSAMERQVESLELEEYKSAEYYSEAIEYFSKYPESQTAHKKIAAAEVKLAKIAEERGHTIFAAPGDTFIYQHDLDAIEHYIQAIAHNKELPDIYNKLGELFFRHHDYPKAIKCYKILDDFLHINKCFKAWIQEDEFNPDIRMERADYCLSVGQNQKALKYYHSSLWLRSKDQGDQEFKDFQTEVLNKMSEASSIPAGLAAQFRTAAQTHDFCDFASVNDEFIRELVGVTTDTHTES